MKIGILTFHRPANFGANLQAYTSVCLFRSLGYDVKIIDFVRPKDVLYQDSVSFEQYNAHTNFVETRLPLTRQSTNEDELVSVVIEEQFEAIVIGADAVWKAPMDNNIYFASWLFNDNRISNIPVISLSPAHMGAGFGKVTEEKRLNIKKCLEKFRCVSVRDEWTKFVINRDIFKGENFVQRVNPDPVIFLSEYLVNEKWDSRGFLAQSYYLLSLPSNWNSGHWAEKRKKWFLKFKRLVNDKGYLLLEFPVPQGKSGMPFDACVEFPLDPIQWFLWIKNAKGFCGLRFHAIVSSISCGVPFYSIDVYGNESKLNTFLDIVGLHSFARRMDSCSKIKNLLDGSGFEHQRTGNHLEFENPNRIFKLLESCDCNNILAFRDKKRNEFKKYISDINNAINND